MGGVGWGLVLMYLRPIPRMTLNSQSPRPTYTVKVEKNKGCTVGLFKSLFDVIARERRKKMEKAGVAFNLCLHEMSPFQICNLISLL